MAFWRRTTVHIDGGAASDVPADFATRVLSQHERLLSEVGSPDSAVWSARALRTVLEGVRDHAGIENIAITDAWIEDDDTFCLVYTPPWGPGLAGTRRRRGDRDPVEQLAQSSSGNNASETLGDPDDQDTCETPADPTDYGATVLDDISQPLGRMHDLLRYDHRGIGWWGTLADTLPERIA